MKSLIYTYQQTVETHISSIQNLLFISFKAMGLLDFYKCRLNEI